MQFCLVLMCVVVPLSLYPVIRGDDDDFSGNGELDNMGSPANNKFLVQSTFQFPFPSHQKSIMENDKIDPWAQDTEPIHSPRDQKSNIMVDDRDYNTQNQAAINSAFNFRTKHMITMEDRINVLIRSIRDVEDMINKLNTKVDRIFQTQNMQFSPKNDDDSVASEILNKLNDIDQYIKRTKRPELLHPDQLQIIKHFMTAIDNADKSLRNFKPSEINQVLENSKRTLDKITNMLPVIDERTRKYDGSSRQLENIGPSNRGWNSLNRGPCKNARLGRLNNNVASERTYQDRKRSTNKVIFEPNSYNCHDLIERRNGVYKFGSQEEVANEAGRFLNERYCEFNADGPAWTVIQRRDINQENFNRTWMDYKLGFGELDEEFWFGNEFIHRLTSDEDMELLIIVEDSSGQQEWAEYSLFRVNEEGLNYNLEIGDYYGSVSNVFLFQDRDFSTYDRQNDNNDNISCASLYGHGWWFNNCTEPADHGYKGLMLDTWLGTNFLKSSRMMIRPKGLWSGIDGNEKRAYTTK